MGERHMAEMSKVLDELGEEREAQVSVATTWKVDEGGNLCHPCSGMRISSADGILFQQREYKLSPDDIEFQDGSALGFGACGVVSRAVIRKTGEQVAVKTVRMDD